LSTTIQTEDPICLYPTILFGKYILNVTLFFVSNYIGMPLEI